MKGSRLKNGHPERRGVKSANLVLQGGKREIDDAGNRGDARRGRVAITDINYRGLGGGCIKGEEAFQYTKLMKNSRDSMRS